MTTPWFTVPPLPDRVGLLGAYDRRRGVVTAWGNDPWSPALTFGAATTDRLTVAAATSIATLSPLTVLQWIYPTTFTVARRLWAKGAPADISQRHVLINTGGVLTAFQDTDGSDATYTTSTAMVLDRWNCIVHTYDPSDGSRAFMGTDRALPVEASYASRAVGSGNAADDSGADLLVCNANFASFGRAFQGRCAYFAYLNYRMTLTDIVDWYQTGQLPTLPRVLFSALVRLGNALIIVDESGWGNDATITGATYTAGPARLVRVGDYRRSLFAPAAPTGVVPRLMLLGVG